MRQNCQCEERQRVFLSGRHGSIEQTGKVGVFHTLSRTLCFQTTNSPQLNSSCFAFMHNFTSNNSQSRGKFSLTDKTYTLERGANAERMRLSL